MIEFNAPASAAVPSLHHLPIFTGFAEVVIEGLAPGRIFAADGVGHIQHRYGMGLVWGEGIGVAFPEVIAHLKSGAYRSKDEWLQIDPRWDYLDWDGALGAEAGGDVPGGDRVQRYSRVNFDFDPALFNDRHDGPVLPDGWRIAPLAAEAYDLDDIAVSPVQFWRDYTVFTAQGGGVVALSPSGEVGAMAFSATRGEGWLEIGIETRAAYRGQGLARAVAVAMIEKCLRRGVKPVWACRKENAASLHLAQSLGFVVTKELPFYRLPAAV